MRCGLAKLLGHVDQLLHHLCGFDGAVLVALDDVAEQLGKLAVQHHVAGEAALDFALQQALQQFDR
ncbi:hypothetical protein D3C85_1779170 [compost metagenome]